VEYPLFYELLFIFTLLNEQNGNSMQTPMNLPAGRQGYANGTGLPAGRYDR